VEDLASKFPELIRGFTVSNDAIINANELEQALARARERTALATLKALEAEQKKNKEEQSKAMSDLKTISGSIRAAVNNDELYNLFNQEDDIIVTHKIGEFLNWTEDSYKEDPLY
jgi:hypothetical protein